MTGPTGSATNNTFNAIKKGGGFQNYTSQQQASLLQGAQKQTTQKGADAFIRAARDVERYRPLGGAKIDAAIASGNIDQLRTVTKELSRMNHELEKQRRHSIGAAAAMSSLQDSTRNMVREYASLYALFAGTTYFKEQVKALDAMGAGLSAVSSSSEETASNIEYLKGIIIKNGLSLKDTTKDFVKLRAAMKGEFNLDQTRQAFESITKSGKILQMSQSELALTTKAITQMFGKEGIRAEELTGQLGDHLPIAMQALQKATGKTSKELFEMMAQGKVGMKYILPFTKAMEDLLDVNGAYIKSLDKLGNVEDSMKAAFSVITAENLDKGGFTEGLKNFYKTITKLVEDNTATLERLGRIYKKVFDGLSVVVKVATQWFATFLRAVESVGQTIGWFVDNPLAGLLVGIPLIAKNMSLLAKVMGAAFKTPLMILTLIIGALDEIRAYFDDDVVGLFDDKGWTDEQSKKKHAQRRLMFGMGSAEDAKLATGDSILTNNPFYRFGEQLGVNTPHASQTEHGSTVLAVLEGFAKTSWDLSISALKDYTSWYSKNTIGGQISITINSPDPEKAGESVKKELERMTDLQAVGAR
jgi:tape measure domain-containing protein